MALEGDDYLHQLFVWHVDDLLNCCDQQPLHPFIRLRMAHCLRILTSTALVTGWPSTFRSVVAVGSSFLWPMLASATKRLKIFRPISSGHGISPNWVKRKGGNTA
jgi:hypothetical protein